MTRRILWLLPFLLAGCVGTADFRPVNVPGEATSELTPTTSVSNDDTLVALAFSGGGMRASAFSYGVLQSLATTPSTTSGKNLIDSVDFVSGVSGGSVTAAYFALKGPEEFSNFRQDFLDKNAEENLVTDISLVNVLRILTFGGVNDRTSFPVWLDDNVFHGATYADVLSKGRPVLWIGASDIFNRTPFVFSGVMFAPLCSDLGQLPLAQAVGASAAVPGAFTPVNVESFAERCEWHPRAGNQTSDLYYSQQAMMESAQHYRDTQNVKYIKLLDGGITDNFGVSGVALSRLGQGTGYAPLNKERALTMKRLLFIVVNSGRSPIDGEWNRRLDNPSIVTLAGAVTDTAIDANTRMTYDFFKIVMKEWERDLIKWRCSLPKEEVVAIRQEHPQWRCDDVKFFVTQVAFADAGPERRTRLDNIPTRFVLPPEDIDFLIESADLALKKNPTFTAFLHSYDGTQRAK